VIHHSAIINKNSKISENVDIGPYCVIGSEVEIAANSKLHSHVCINGNTKIGKNNEI
jgi:UDP-N-acetylglucosamine acyltransferase